MHPATQANAPYLFDGHNRFLSTLGSMGITGNSIIVHDWQHWGYDTKLPDHFPANPARGGRYILFNINFLLNLRFLSASMVPLIQKAKSYGNRIALHENYVDMYPDSPLYNFSDVAWTATAVKNAWLNKGTGVQAVQSISLKSLLFLINVYFSIKRAFT